MAGWIEIIMELMQLPSLNLNIKSSDGSTALHFLVNIVPGAEEEALYRAVLHRMRDLGTDLDAINYSGDAPLHVACTRANVVAMRFLLEKGADTTIKNGHNQLPIDIARQHDNGDALLRIFRDSEKAVAFNRARAQLQKCHKPPRRTHSFQKEQSERMEQELLAAERKLEFLVWREGVLDNEEFLSERSCCRALVEVETLRQRMVKLMEERCDQLRSAVEREHRTELARIEHERQRVRDEAASLRRLHATTDMIFALGGSDGWTQLESTERFDAELNEWRVVPAAALSCGRWAGAAASFRHFLYVVGGSDGTTRLSSLERFNTRTGFWTRHPPMPSPRYNIGTVCISGEFLMVVGGHDGYKALRECIMFDLKRERWVEVEAMCARRMAPGVCVLEDEFVFAVGGNDGNVSLSSVER
eukprot:TRINITY_DN7829_c0_g1_i2.p1 TRINITY_DN7829_c0_g1~~TRINITY_DN7829_c0_g1_i2.p1  ORF type:complete len:467 (-),score=155.92 TRINITY_DN7829_c0_g1_i2:66-1313(-)